MLCRQICPHFVDTFASVYDYTGNLTATPNAGTAAVTSINLTVNVVAGAPALSLLSCSSNNFTTTPNKASTTCSLKNTGTVAISSISYGTPAGMSTTGPTGACAANTVCGTVIVSTGTTAGNYTGTLSISSVPAASSATNLAIDLTVNGINAETVTYLHTDGLGSPVAKSNASGVRIKQTKYEAYGMTVAGSDKPTIGFTGHYNDSDTELTYMQQRYYDPVAGRFLSEDPVLTDANSGKSFNRYVYASNNPYKYIDPDGRDDKDAFAPVPSAAEQFRPHGEMMGKAILEIGKAYVTVMSVLVPELGGARAVGTTMATAKVASVAVKSAEQAKNIERFVKKLPTNAKDSVSTNPLPNGGIAAQATSPGRVPGSSAVYEKQIDSAGKTIQYTKTTNDPAGNIVHVKDKITGEVFK